MVAKKQGIEGCGLKKLAQRYGLSLEKAQRFRLFPRWETGEELLGESPQNAKERKRLTGLPGFFGVGNEREDMFLVFFWKGLGKGG